MQHEYIKRVGSRGKNFLTNVHKYRVKEKDTVDRVKEKDTVDSACHCYLLLQIQREAILPRKYGDKIETRLIILYTTREHDGN